MSDVRAEELNSATHVVIGEATGGSLKLGNPAWQVVPLVDDWTIGPILLDQSTSDDARSLFWNVLYEKIAATYMGPLDDAARADLLHGKPVVLWVGQWARERLGVLWLVDRLCRQGGEQVFILVDAPELMLSVLKPSQLRELESRARHVDDEWVQAALASWKSICKSEVPDVRWHRPAKPDELFNTMPCTKLWQRTLGAELFGDDGGELERRLLLQTGDEYRKAVHIVGTTMADAPIGDAWLHARLINLCERGLLMAEGALTPLRELRVRRPHGVNYDFLDE